MRHFWFFWHFFKYSNPDSNLFKIYLSLRRLYPIRLRFIFHKTIFHFSQIRWICEKRSALHKFFVHITNSFFVKNLHWGCQIAFSTNKRPFRLLWKTPLGVLLSLSSLAGPNLSFQFVPDPRS